jgi:hypothetical protein
MRTSNRLQQVESDGVCFRVVKVEFVVESVWRFFGGEPIGNAGEDYRE